jgi:hypothetical protein
VLPLVVPLDVGRSANKPAWRRRVVDGVPGDLELGHRRIVPAHLSQVAGQGAGGETTPCLQGVCVSQRGRAGRRPCVDALPARA